MWAHGQAAFKSCVVSVCFLKIRHEIIYTERSQITLYLTLLLEETTYYKDDKRNDIFHRSKLVAFKMAT